MTGLWSKQRCYRDHVTQDQDQDQALQNQDQDHNGQDEDQDQSLHANLTSKKITRTGTS